VQIDFSPIDNKEIKMLEFSQQFTLDDLRAATNTSIDTLLEIISDLDDADIVFDPLDPTADDPYAVEGEERIGWHIGHLIAHMTASSEEGAAFSSILARGIEIEPRLRYELPWKEIVGKAKCVQRLEESRRIRLAYLETWPDAPHLDVYRILSERFIERFGNLNAPASFLFGLMHELGHYEQVREVKRQALAAKQQA